jgi:hypothetical protein
MLIIYFSSSSFIANISDKLRRKYLQNGFSLLEILSNPSFCNDIVDRLKRDRKTTCKYFYKLYLENINKCSQDKWPRN